MAYKSKLTREEIVSLYNADVRITDIAATAGISRQAVRAALIREGAYDPLHGSKDRKCNFCGASFRAWRNRIKKGTGNYCSIQCFHSDRAMTDGETAGQRINRLYEEVYGVTSRTLQRRARKVANASKGQVVHHKDGNKANNEPSNLEIYDNHSDHMKAHHNHRRSMGTHPSQKKG